MHGLIQYLIPAGISGLEGQRAHAALVLETYRLWGEICPSQAPWEGGKGCRAGAKKSQVSALGARSSFVPGNQGEQEEAEE